jgi:hypothetical protein
LYGSYTTSVVKKIVANKYKPEIITTFEQINRNGLWTCLGGTVIAFINDVKENKFEAFESRHMRNDDDDDDKDNGTKNSTRSLFMASDLIKNKNVLNVMKTKRNGYVLLLKKKLDPHFTSNDDANKKDRVALGMGGTFKLSVPIRIESNVPYDWYDQNWYTYDAINNCLILKTVAKGKSKKKEIHEYHFTQRQSEHMAVPLPLTFIYVPPEGACDVHYSIVNRFIDVKNKYMSIIGDYFYRSSDN